MKKRMHSSAFGRCIRAYDLINRNAMWQILIIYGVGGRSRNGMKSKFINSEAFVRIKRAVVTLVCETMTPELTS